tara:strand:+ start:17956 stop:18471 length:516 start_codon:yes stop_codon:yes gene_type:complete
MPEASHEFVSISHFIPETFGEPGQRTFRINVVSESSDAKLWLEKQQLAELCITIMQTDEYTKNKDLKGPSNIPENIKQSQLTYLDFKVFKLAFGYNDQSGLFIVEAYELDNESPTVRIWIPRKTAIEFANKGLEIVSAGRPLCDLCENPMNPEGHACERKNGHSKKGQDIL